MGGRLRLDDLVERHVKWRKRKDRLVLHDHTGSAAIVLGAIRIRRNDYPFRSTRRQPARFALASLAAFFCLCNPGAAPFTVQGPGVNSTDFRVTTFASGLDFPLGMARLSDGSLLVAVSQGEPSE